jgi:hypothetical protein
MPPPDGAPTVVERRAPPPAVEKSVASTQPSIKRIRVTVLIGLALALVGLGSGATWLTTRRSPVAPWPSFVVIEKQRLDEAPGAAPSASDFEASPSAESARPSASGTPPTGTGSAAASVSTGRSSPGGSPGGFSRAFQQQQPGVERCFARHAADVEGQPTIMVRFTIDTRGLVQRADLTPSALSGTPLGQCLLAEARAARFGAQPEPVTFTIPVTARRTR